MIVTTAELFRTTYTGFAVGAYNIKIMEDCSKDTSKRRPPSLFRFLKARASTRDKNAGSHYLLVQR